MTTPRLPASSRSHRSSKAAAAAKGAAAPKAAAASKATSAAKVPARGFDSLEQEVFLNLWRTYDRLKALEDEALGQAGLSAQQYNTLRLLRSVAPGSMATLELGSRLISRAPDMTRLLDRLEARGLLSRERRSDNRRVVAVKLTSQGKTLLNQIHQTVLDCHRQQLGHLDAKSLRQLATLLKQARQPHEDAGHRSFIDE